MSSVEILDPLVQHHIVNTLGWRELRDLQELSIEPILQGDHSLLIAPTAGGKTEAALLPVLSRICAENWPPLSVLYICPLKALLNNLAVRLERYTTMVGRRSAVWHGDIPAHERLKIRREPPDILLTTPESLEAMLVSTQPEGREMLRSAGSQSSTKSMPSRPTTAAGICWPCWNESANWLGGKSSGSGCRPPLEIPTSCSDGWPVTAKANAP